jgi:BirA family transcriptional regulator, biotin operon repressor / biotin---[acetyl-CoA-carboxylase] ligase
MVADTKIRPKGSHALMAGDSFNSDILKSRLASLPIGGIRYYESTGSTNDEAFKWIGEGASDKNLVIADEQTAGRGRMQRRWITRKGAALAFSIIFKPQPSTTLPLFAPLGALGVAMALENLYSIQPQIKWPNDVLINRKKVCGILTEASWQGDVLAGVVLGIGINIALTSVRLEDEFLFPAGSLQENLGFPVDRLDLLAEVLNQIFKWQVRMGSEEFIAEWNRRLAFRGEQVAISQPGQDVLTGTILQISQDGLLWVRRDDGEEVPVSAGDVSTNANYSKPEK